MPGASSAPDPTQKRAADVRSMFGRIVPRYDRMNRIMTLGMDGGWRRATARAALSEAPTDACALDLGAGTGDLARELRRAGAAQVIAADFTRPMLLAGQHKKGLAHDRVVAWVQADALHLPFPDATFDAIASGFLLRNLEDLSLGLAEMLRVLKPGGRLAALEITHPPRGPAGAVMRFGFRYVMTPMAGALSGDRAAYHYLPASLTTFPDARTLASMLESAGGTEARYRRLGGGVMALHTARRR